MFAPKKKVKEPDSQEHAHGYCLFLLGLRLRTEGEIQEKMKGRGYTTEVINEEIKALKQAKYINDERFAEIFTDNMKKYKPYGYYKIQRKLMEKRLPHSIIQKALEEYFKVADEIEVGRKILKKEKDFGSTDFAVKHKLAQRLKSRGFRTEVISKLIT